MPRRELFAPSGRSWRKFPMMATWPSSVMGAPGHCSIATSPACQSAEFMISRRPMVETGSHSIARTGNSCTPDGARSTRRHHRASHDHDGANDIFRFPLPLGPRVRASRRSWAAASERASGSNAPTLSCCSDDPARCVLQAPRLPWGMVCCRRNTAGARSPRSGAPLFPRNLKAGPSFPCAWAFGDRRWRGRRQVAIGPPGLFGLVRRDDLGA